VAITYKRGLLGHGALCSSRTAVFLFLGRFANVGVFTLLHRRPLSSAYRERLAAWGNRLRSIQTGNRRLLVSSWVKQTSAFRTAFRFSRSIQMRVPRREPPRRSRGHCCRASANPRRSISAATILLRSPNKSRGSALPPLRRMAAAGLASASVSGSLARPPTRATHLPPGQTSISQPSPDLLGRSRRYVQALTWLKEKPATDCRFKVCKALFCLVFLEHFRPVR